jgi:hypothetical protein
MIEWSTGDGSPGVIYVEAEGEERLFARGAEGSQAAPWISPGVIYRFTLYGDKKRRRPLRSATVAMDDPPPPPPTPAAKPFIQASPNPIPETPGGELGFTTVEWSTGDGSTGWVYLRTAGSQNVLFAAGPAGTQSISWVRRNFDYRFTLYADDQRKKKLAAVNVTMGNPRRELMLDLAVVGGAVVTVVTPVALAAWTVTRVARKIRRR